MNCNCYEYKVNNSCVSHGEQSSIRKQVLIEFESRIARLPDGDKDSVIAICACGKHHKYTPRSLLSAMKDPSNEEGMYFLNSFIKLRASL